MFTTVNNSIVPKNSKSLRSTSSALILMAKTCLEMPGDLETTDCGMLTKKLGDNFEI